ncbi:MAG: hypothetical protein ACE37J_03945 [Pikeienuella sp.]|uniref:hypothetical protein n=1 Tax=Pikeienuella sp. TaxID=2831957 RepID=UPI00391A7155
MDSRDGAWSGAERFDVETADADRKARRRLAESTEGDRFAKEDNRAIATLHYGEPEMPEALRSAVAEEGGAAGEADGAAPADAAPEVDAAPRDAEGGAPYNAFAADARSDAAPAPDGALTIPNGKGDATPDLAPEAPVRQGAAPARSAAAIVDLSPAGDGAAPADPERPGEENPPEGPAEPPREPVGESEPQDPDGEEPAPATNKAPTAVSLSASEVDENAAGAVIGTVTVADPDDGDSHSLSVSDARFEIVGGQLKLKDGVSLDHEAEPTVSVTVTATDSGGLSKAQSFDIAVADLNEGPTAVSLSATDVDENAAGAVIGTVTVADPDDGDSHTLAVSDARFEIVGGQLKLKDGVSLDHEAEPTVSVTVTATDAGGLSRAQSFDIAVADLNEGPTAVSLSATDVDENAAGAVIGTVTVVDPDDGDAHTLSVSDARFEVVGGQLKLKDGVSLDHEAEPTVSVTVTATDSGGLSKVQSFDIAVSDLNEGPTAVSLSASDVDENAAGAVIGTVTVADPDDGDSHSLRRKVEIVGQEAEGRRELTRADGERHRR